MAVISEVKAELNLRNQAKYESAMILLTSKLSCDNRRTILRGQETGQYRDAKSNRSKAPDKVLAAQEREKKKKYLEACLEQRRHFSPFVVSTDGLLAQFFSETVRHARVKVGETLLRSLWIDQGLHEHCHSQSHPSLSPRITNSLQ
jgi:hypothetical protein